MPINKLRAEAKNKKDFDKSLESLINLYTHQPETEYPDGEMKQNNINLNIIHKFFKTFVIQLTQYGRNSKTCSMLLDLFMIICQHIKHIINEY